MLIQIHILQNYAPANLNRDDTGSPKDAIFGGTRRGRISSQCLKRSIRKSTAFAEAFGATELLGVRTKQLPTLIRQELQTLGADDQMVQAIMERVAEIGRESGKAKPEEDTEPASVEGEPEAETDVVTKQLIFIGRDELQPMAQKLIDLYKQYGVKKWSDKKLKIGEITKELGRSMPRSIDIAMFGRMTTSEAFEDVQAAVQVAHALSTNALAQEFDYYTAVDDLSNESGAGMIGDVEFNSSTYYKYLNVHWEKLVENLGNDLVAARQAVKALVEAAATAQPSGKQNSFAAHSLPDLVLLEVRDKNLPVSYANAFVKPVRPNGDESLMDASTTKLADYMGRAIKTYNLSGTRAFTALQDYVLPEATAQASLADLQQWLVEQLPG